MLKPQLEPIDHGQEFSHKAFHQLLHYIMRVRKEYGVDSFQYDDMIVRLATDLSNVQDLNQFDDNELYHFFMKEHKPDMDKALAFMRQKEELISKESLKEKGYEQETVLRDKYGPPGLESIFDRPNRARGADALEPVYKPGRPGYARRFEDKHFDNTGFKFSHMMSEWYNSKPFKQIVGEMEEENADE